MKIPFIETAKTLTVYLENKVHNFLVGTDEHKKAVTALHSDDPEGLEEAINGTKPTTPEQLKSELKDGFEITEAESGEYKIAFEGEVLPQVLQDKLISLYEQGYSLERFNKFWSNLSENPSQASVEQLYNFLEYKELPITEDGYFLAYKGLKSDYYSISGNTETKVLKGVVNSRGEILNKVGETIEVLRRHVDDNPDNHCSTGIHTGSLEYATSFAQGKVVVIKIHPKDVVSVPTDCQAQKLRCCKYEVISEFEQEITHAVTDSEGRFIEPDKIFKDPALLFKFVEQTIKKMLESDYSENSTIKFSELAYELEGEFFELDEDWEFDFDEDQITNSLIASVVNSMGLKWAEVNGEDDPIILTGK